jgi:hypothetical protein
VVVRDAPGALRVDAEGPQPVEPFDQVQEVAGARRAGRRAEPREAAEPVLGLDLEQRVEPPRAVRVEPVGEARQDLPLGPDEGVGAQALDRARPGDDHPPPADLVERPARQMLERLDGFGRAAHPGLPDLRLQPVGEKRIAQPAWSPQVREQVSGGPAWPRAADQRQQPAAERGVADRHEAVDRIRDPVALEDVAGQGGIASGIAEDDRDVAWARPGAQQREHLGSDQLDLRPGPARREQPNRVRIRGLRRIVDEEPALECVQSFA